MNIKKSKKFKSPYIKEMGHNVSTVNKTRFRESSPYTKKKYFLNEVEKDFYDKLKLVLEDTNYYICPKVSLTSFIYVNEEYDYKYYFDKIKTKFIDYLICDKSTMIPLIVIELDSPDYKSKDIIELDKFFNMTLNDADIPIFRFDVLNYSVDEIRDKFNNILVTVPD